MTLNACIHYDSNDGMASFFLFNIKFFVGLRGGACVLRLQAINEIT